MLSKGLVDTESENHFVNMIVCRDKLSGNGETFLLVQRDSNGRGTNMYYFSI